VLSAGSVRQASSYLRIISNATMNDVHTVNMVDQLELQKNPDYNIDYSETCHMPFPSRPFMLGRPGTAVEALRNKEQGDWHDLSAQEKEDLYRAYFDRPYLEQFQGTDMWKGILGMVMIGASMVSFICYNMCHDVFGWNPKEAGFWYWWQPGWQQMRKNEAAHHILWEYDNMGDQRDIEHWDYVNHCWKNPGMPRLDASY